MKASHRRPAGAAVLFRLASSPPLEHHARAACAPYDPTQFDPERRCCQAFGDQINFTPQGRSNPRPLGGIKVGADQNPV